ncbi:MAG: hypothetical protein MK066_12210 [Crocinitomicaceae bacterium]|nr:hypothetical protein [Crocinitomicaceae bacterium]
MKAITYHIKGVVKSFEELFKGNYLIYLLPGLIITLIFGLFFYEISVLDDATAIGGDEGWIQKGLSYVGGFFGWILSWFDFIIEYIYIFIVITVLSPFNAALASNFDRDLTGFNAEGGFGKFMNDIIRMIFVVILMVVMENLLSFIVWCCSWFVPGEDIWKAPIKLIITAFFFGLSFYDFALERRGKGVFSTIGYAFTYPLGMIITGLIFLGIYNIPWIGIPLSPVIAVMVSTVAYLYYEKQLPKKSTELKPTENE